MSLLGEGVVRDAHKRFYPATQPTMNYMMDRVPGDFFCMGLIRMRTSPSTLCTPVILITKKIPFVNLEINVMSQIK